MAKGRTFERIGTVAALRAFLSVAGPRRRLQLYATLILTLLGAVAELVTIGAVLPLLAIASSDASAAQAPVIGGALARIGVGGEGGIFSAAAFLIGAAILATIVRLLLSWVTQKFVYGLQHDLVMRVFERAIRQPYDWHVRQNSSVLISALEKIFIVIVGVISPLLLAATSAVIATCIILFLLMLDPWTTLIAATVIGGLYVAMSLFARGRMAKLSGGLASMRTARVKTVQEALGGIRDILIDHSQPVFERKLDRDESHFDHLLVRANFLQSAPRFVVEGASIVLIAIVAAWFSFQPGGMLAAIPILGAIALGAQRLLPLIQTIYVGWASCSVHAGSTADVLALMNGPAGAVVPLRPGADVQRLREAIVLDGVVFRYSPEGVPALSNIDLTIAKGERIGLIGKTGSGKSTLVDILMGLLRPVEGEISIDGERLDESSLANWQAQIAHVPQVIFLTDDTIAANIAFGCEPDKVDPACVRDAAARAGILEFIGQLPKGFQTEVGERGIRLSGGQRQRIGIARALYKEATVLILDEATSALDYETEAAVMQSVARFDRSLTLVMIAHRLSSLSDCDRIYRLDGGRITGVSTYDELVAAEPLRTGSAQSP